MRMAATMLRVAATASVLLLLLQSAHSQTQTSGNISGTVQDAQGASIASAQVVARDLSTNTQRTALTNDSGAYALSLLPSGVYQVTVSARGFETLQFPGVRVAVTETRLLNATLQVAKASDTVNVIDPPASVPTDAAQVGTLLQSKELSALPTSSRNVLQEVTLSPGVSGLPVDNSAIGRNTPDFSVNGARVTQNSVQLNGVDVNSSFDHDVSTVPIPAIESIQEVVVQTSMPDASVGGAGGGQVQVVTRSGNNNWHGQVYEYFQNEALNANDPNLKAAGVERPLLRRNVFGATLGGPLRTNKAFFFISYQGSRELNGATDQSLYRNVLIADGLTDDRSEGTLLSTFHPVLPDGVTQATSIDPVALKLLNAHLPNRKFLIPTPQIDGRVSGTEPSTYREDQFNANVDVNLSQKDVVSAKFFFSDFPQVDALGEATLPGFGDTEDNGNRVLAVQETHLFGPRFLNEARAGFNFTRNRVSAQESLRDTDVGIVRPTSDIFPGLPKILLARDAGGAVIGSPFLTIDLSMPSLTAADSILLQHGRHLIRAGGEFAYYRTYGGANVDTYGEIDFATFNDFLTGHTDVASLGSGLDRRDFIASSYSFFVQDKWKVSPRFTLTLGLRYELDLPPYDTRGRMATFDPTLYRARMETSDGFPVGPPLGGIVQAGNVISRYDLPEVPNVSKRLLRSIDPNNLGPRLGFAWAPFKRSERVLLRGGYGVFYSRPSFGYAALNFLALPYFLFNGTAGAQVEAAFQDIAGESQFPMLPVGTPLTGIVIDRSLRTPYFQQFNTSVQAEIRRNLTLEAAYVGTRGLRLLRQVGINQARIASLDHPIVNEVTGEVITANTNDNASLRAPFQGVPTGQNEFSMNRSDGQSTYHSLQLSLSRRVSNLIFGASYTFSKSIDNGSNPGGGVLPSGALDRGSEFDTSLVIGNQLDGRKNRGLSDFDRTHHLVIHYVWDLPKPFSSMNSRFGRLAFTGWQTSGIVTLMSGLPVDTFDPAGGSLYGLDGTRPSWAPGANRGTATHNAPAGYYFNPAAFTTLTLQPGQLIPSANDATALAGDLGSDIGNVGRNFTRGPGFYGVDCSIRKRFSFSEHTGTEFRADFLNVFNHAIRSNPIGDLGAGADFGRIVGFDSSPRIIQLSLKVSF
jgi:carboxypeptidase family protein/TonB-dependent receptor-like protein